MESAESRSGSSKAKTTRRAPRPEGVARNRARAAAASKNGGISPEERHRIIAEAAYYRAEQRRFLGGDPLQDWLEAEAEVAVRLRDLDALAGKPASR
jgi:hypothetical protein